MPSSFDVPVLRPASSLNAVPLLPIIREYMSQLGKRGGSSKSAKKTAAAKRNGRRPKKSRE